MLDAPSPPAAPAMWRPQPSSTLSGCTMPDVAHGHLGRIGLRQVADRGARAIKLQRSGWLEKRDRMPIDPRLRPPGIPVDADAGPKARCHAARRVTLSHPGPAVMLHRPAPGGPSAAILSEFGDIRAGIADFPFTPVT